VIFAYLDGDDVGTALELMLLDGHVEEARSYSLSVSQAFEAARAILESHPGVDVIIAGGDDLVASWHGKAVDFALIEAVRNKFAQACGKTMSAGVGFTASEATGNLRRAKLMGKNRVVAPTVIEA
jgi:CRISPR/Cas system-associated protein Cas10 (large subunit of type III CRISPR-Cas system)